MKLYDLFSCFLAPPAWVILLAAAAVMAAEAPVAEKSADAEAVDWSALSGVGPQGGDWAKRRPPVLWSWSWGMREVTRPRDIKVSNSSGAAIIAALTGIARGPRVVHQEIVAWDPGRPAGKRQLYYQLYDDGAEKRFDESQFTRGRVVSQRRIFVTDPATGRKRAVQELTYEDGSTGIALQDPLVFDLKGGGVQTDQRRVLFGLTGTERKDKLRRLNDLGPGEGLLVFDANGNGTSGETGLELFGDQTDLDRDGKSDDFPNGFAALRAFADKAAREGVLPREPRDRLDEAALAALAKAYGLKMKVGGFNAPPVSLAEAGVQAIALSTEPVERAREFDGRGNFLSLQAGAVFLRADGTVGTYVNVWFSSR